MHYNSVIVELFTCPLYYYLNTLMWFVKDQQFEPTVGPTRSTRKMVRVKSYSFAIKFLKISLKISASLKIDVKLKTYLYKYIPILNR